ncbi:MAG TPA: hypothetical protein VGF17_27555 [Phytomonospora sp.]
MGTIPTIPSFVAGAVLTAAQLNQINAVSDFWAAPPRCHAEHTTIVSLPNATYTLIPLQSETFDVVQVGDAGMHDLVVNNSRIYARTAGKYRISGQLVFAANATGVRIATVRLNAAGLIGGGTGLLSTNQNALSSGTTAVPLPPDTFTLAAGDYVEMFGYQNSGAALNTDPNFARLLVELVSA